MRKNFHCFPSVQKVVLERIFFWNFNFLGTNSHVYVFSDLHLAQMNSRGADAVQF